MFNNIILFNLCKSVSNFNFINRRMFLSKIIPNRGILSIKPYVPGKSIKEVIRELNIIAPIKMASNENPLGISPFAEEAIKKISSSAFQYPEVTCYDLREVLCRHLNISKNNLILCNGGDSVIYNIAMCLINPGDEVIIPKITFPIYETIVKALNGNIIYSKMTDFSINLDDIISKITDKTKIIWLCNPNNPTGKIIKKDEFDNFINRVPDYVMIVHDEVYYDFADEKQFPDTVKLIKNGMENIFLVRSFSKIYGLAGVRLGYGIGSKTIIDLMYRIRIPFDVSVLAQAAGIGAVNDNKFYKRSIDLIQTEKQYLYNELNKLGIKYIESNTNFILINVGKNSESIVEELLKKGVIVRPTRSHNLPESFRVTIGMREHNERFIKALTETLAETIK